MKPAAPDNCNGVTPLRVLLALLLCAALPLLAFAAAPAWWAQRGVTVPNASADDYAPANQGQLKNIAKAAVAEMDEKLPGGAGQQLHDLIDVWSNPSGQTNDFAPLNLGQLKNVVRPFYDRLIAAGLANAYPWTGSVAPADDFAVANIGQVKNLFSFEIGAANPLDDPLADRLAASQRAGNLALEAQAVWFWGNRFVADSSFQSMFPRRLTGLPALKSVSLGDDHFAVLAADGTVLTWGKNNLGQLGDGTNADRTAPAPVPNLANIKSVKAGGAHTLALQQDGTVLAWGDNYYGQLGTGDTTLSNIPVQVPGLTGVSKLAAGPARSVALKSDGTVWTWGYEHYAGQDIFSATPVQMPDLLDVVDIAVGYEHVVAVKADGTVWAWGSNYSHQIGDGSSTGSYHQTPVQVPGLIDVVKVASSWDHTLAVTSDGTVWAWGYNSFGQLGDDTTQPRSGPVQVSGLTGVIAIATSWSYSMAMKADGTVWAWGDGASGTLPGVDPYVPQQIGLGLLDTNQNGMDDRWEMEYFGDLDQAADADFDGDGISNLQEYLQGTDPTDYFNGTTPLIEIVSGNNQIGDAGTVGAQPLVVRVKKANGQLAVNAPVAFTVTSGSAEIVTGQDPHTVTVRTGPDGTASVQFGFGQTSGVSSRIGAFVGRALNQISRAFRVISRYVSPPTTTPTPPPEGSPTPSPSPTATPVPPYRYAIIDLGKGVQPNRVNNKGTVLVHSLDENSSWVPSRWKGGVLERLTYSGAYSSLWAYDINDQDVVVGTFYRSEGPWNAEEVRELEGGLRWPGNRATADKISALSAFPGFGPHTGDLMFKSASLMAIRNSGEAFGQMCTGSVSGFLNNLILVMNSMRVPAESTSPIQIGDAAATNDPENDYLSHWTGTVDSISRVSAGHYIGRKITPFADNYGDWWNPLGPQSGMIDGHAVDFNPTNLNEGGVVIGTTSDNPPMTIRTLPVPPLAAVPDVVLPGVYPIAINTHLRPAATASGSPSPTPAPIPVPQILGWDGSTTVLWERQPDTQIWHPFGLEEMIPNMDGWEIWYINDMNDDGVIVGSGSFKDPNNPQAQAEDHALMLVPLELLSDLDNDGKIGFIDQELK
ncbi:MAG: hypothetical protein WAO00_04590, partial [Chthoniobacterales bacterium]